MMKLLLVVFATLVVTAQVHGAEGRIQSQQVSQPKKLGLNIALFRKLGIKGGDKIVSVNGQEIREPKEAFQKLNQYTPQDNVTVVVLREGREVILSTQN